MSRENMFIAKEREEWVTSELETALKNAAKDGKISCNQAMAFANSHRISMNKMKYLMDLFINCLGISFL